MTAIDLVDDTFVAAPPTVVAGHVHDPSRWAVWWPDLGLVVSRDRGPKGVQWVVAGRARGWTGTAEVWLEPWGDGVLVHHYLRLDPVDGGDRLSPRRADAERRRRALAWKAHVHALKDALERGRRPGEPVVG
ncbi:polyketide cyclase / dehydrase and lipid transport [Thalassiella azotivora]